MQAFVLAAGRGERLLPFTRYVPKPLFHLAGRPLLGLLFDNLRAQGFFKIGLNVHHLADQVVDFVRSYQARHPEITFAIFRESELLGPVGAFYGAREFFSEPTLVINADIVTNFPLKTICQAHLRSPAAATMLLHRLGPANKVEIKGDLVCGFSAGQQGFTYSGIQVVSPELVRALGPGDRDLVPAYQRLMEKGLTIRALVVPSLYWRDVGTLKSYLKAHEDLLVHRAILPGLSLPQNPFVYPLDLPQNVQLQDWCFLEPGVKVSSECRLRRVVAWAGATIPPGQHTDCLFIPQTKGCVTPL